LTAQVLRDWVYLCNVVLLLTDEDGMMSNVTAKKWENLRSSIYIEGGGFDVKNCPNPLELAAKIVKCVNYHERLVGHLDRLCAHADCGDVPPWIEEWNEVRALLAELDKEPAQ
jgi:hypothetical protein